jgi:hypothetical protein
MKDPVDIPHALPATCRLVFGLALAECSGGPALAQTQAKAEATCTVRILPRAAAGYDPSTEMVLRGRVIGRENGLILLRIPAGIVRVDAGAWDEAAAREAGVTLEILASKRQENGRQRFLAREIRHPGGRVVIRDALGVPVPVGGPAYSSAPR